MPTFIPTTFWPLTSINWWSVKIPFLAAEESFTMDLILPFLNTKPMNPWLSFCMVIVLSNGLLKKQIVVYISINAQKNILLKQLFLFV